MRQDDNKFRKQNASQKPVQGANSQTNKSANQNQNPGQKQNPAQKGSTAPNQVQKDKTWQNQAQHKNKGCDDRSCGK